MVTHACRSREKDEVTAGLSYETWTEVNANGREEISRERGQLPPGYSRAAAPGLARRAGEEDTTWGKRKRRTGEWGTLGVER